MGRGRLASWGGSGPLFGSRFRALTIMQYNLQHRAIKGYPSIYLCVDLSILFIYLSTIYSTSIEIEAVLSMAPHVESVCSFESGIARIRPDRQV